MAASSRCGQRLASVRRDLRLDGGKLPSPSTKADGTFTLSDINPHNTLNSSQPAYLHSLLSYHIPARSLRSSNTNLLSVPRVNTTFAFRGFSVVAPPQYGTHSLLAFALVRHHIHSEANRNNASNAEKIQSLYIQEGYESIRAGNRFKKPRVSKDFNPKRHKSQFRVLKIFLVQFNTDHICYNL